MNLEKERLDLRTRRTRQLLRDALITLLKDRDLETIRVKDICDQAMVHRTTFYKHYFDKFDLLNQSIAQVFRELSEGLPVPEEVVLPNSFNEPLANLIRLFQHAAENPAFYTVMLSTGITSFRKQLENYLVERNKVRIRALTQQKKLSAAFVPEDLLAHYGVGAVVKVLAWWLEQKDAPSPIEMARYLTRLLYDGVRPSLVIN